MEHLLTVRDLKTQFDTPNGLVKAVDGISYNINDKEIVGLVGESGCGKSVSQLSVMQLIQTPPGKIVNGEVIFEGQDLMQVRSNSKEMRSIRGGEIGMVFQEPMTSLNPVLTIAQQMTETMKLHLQMEKHVATKLAADLLDRVGISDPEKRLNEYPHTFSGGMRQRIMIAMAISCDPKLIIADEPTTAVDVTTQAQLLELLKELIEKLNSALIIVTHDLGVVARYVNRLYVMYAGRIIESGTTKEIFGNPRHPYTVGLIKSLPRLDEPKKKKLTPIHGVPPNLVNMPTTCAFLPRCKNHTEKCKREPWPGLKLINGQHYVACYNYLETNQNEHLIK